MEATLNMDGRYQVSYWPGVAVWIKRQHTETIGEDILVCNEDECPHDLSEMCWIYEEGTVMVPDAYVVVMVGDDREHVVAVEDLTEIDEDAYCGGCGQIGCGHDGR